MTAVRFVEPDLQRIDALETDLVIAGFFEDRRPMKGLAGLIDWRFAGKLSALLREQFVAGGAGEALLVAGRPRLPCDKAVLVGLGRRDAFDAQTCAAAIEHVVRTTRGLGAERVLVELPGRGDDAVSAASSAELLLACEGGSALLAGAWIVESPAGQAAFARKTDEVRRQRRAP